MRKLTVLRALLFALTFSLLAPFSLFAQPGTWVTTFGSAISDGPEDILVDAAGNVYVCGYFRDTMQIGGMELASAGENDVFVAKFNSTGQLVWANRYGWNSDEFVHALDFDNLGNIIVAGEYQDSSILVNDTIRSWDTLYNGNPAPVYDAFWMRLTPAGTMAHHWEGGWYGTEKFLDMQVGLDDKYYFAGLYRTFNNWTYTDVFDPRGWGGGYDDAIWVRSDDVGVMDHKAVARGKYVDRANALTLIGDSLVVMAGSFQDTCYFRDSTVYGIAGFDDNVWVACYADTGTFKWLVSGGSKGIDNISSVVSDAAGNIYVAGWFDSLLTLGGVQAAGSLYLDGFVAKLDPQGNVSWIRKLGGNGYDAAQELYVTAGGQLLVTGYFQGSLPLDGTHDLILADTTNQNAYVLLMDLNGNYIWAREFGGDAPDFGISLAEDGSGNLYAMGIFNGVGQFGQEQPVSNGGDDAYILRMTSDGSVSAQDAHNPSLGQVIAWPNPTRDQFHISVELSQTAEVQLQVLSLGGQVVQAQALGRRAPGKLEMDLDMGALAPGMYLYRVQAGTAVHTGKVAVVR